MDIHGTGASFIMGVSYTSAGAAGADGNFWAMAVFFVVAGVAQYVAMRRAGGAFR